MSKQYLGVDYGTKRTGLARGNDETCLARAWQTVETSESLLDTLAKVVLVEGITGLVLGLPRSLDGDDTSQTTLVREFAATLGASIECTVILQDEAGTSSVAEERLQAAGRPYAKGDIDAEAAAIILQDYLDSL